MSDPAARTANKRLSPRRLKTIVICAAVVVLLVFMGFSVKVVPDGSTLAGGGAPQFDPATYGKHEFPKVQKAIRERAVDAKTLADALDTDQEAAAKKYGVQATVGTEYCVKFSGKVTKIEDGDATVEVDGLPKDLVIRFQTGPAINGTDLRDATGKITFGQFTNQIDYQNAGAALNNEMKQEVLSKINTDQLKGKSVSVVGAFQLINPKGWLITPSEVTVQ